VKQGTAPNNQGHTGKSRSKAGKPAIAKEAPGVEREALIVIIAFRHHQRKGCKKHCDEQEYPHYRFQRIAESKQAL
jgi:hypothetical protein